MRGILIIISISVRRLSSCLLVYDACVGLLQVHALSSLLEALHAGSDKSQSRAA